MTVDFTVSDGLATITLARPQAHNALDAATKGAFLEAARKAAGDNSVRAVLLRAEGRNFCVGQDLGEHATALEADPATAMNTVADDYNPLIRTLAEIEVPMVVAVQGACVGAGLGIALSGDFVIAGGGTNFATAFTGIGLASDSGLSHSLVVRLGPSRASALMMLGDKVSAEQAREWGLVHQVVADEDVDRLAESLARKLAAGPTSAYREVKALVRESSVGLGAALDREAAAQGRLGISDDHAAAVRAFLDKQRPQFAGR